MDAPTSPLADLRRLGLLPGAAPEELKTAWRRAVSQLHPDRKGEGGDGALAEVNAAFQRLQAFHRRHGRLPNASDAAAPRQPPPAPRSARSRWMMASAVIAIATLVLWPHAEDPTEARSEPSEPAPAASIAEVTSVDPRVIGQRPELIEIGLDPEGVERLAGPPMFRSAERWEYGPSEVRFTDGKVSGWYSSPLRPLPVTDMDPHSARAD